MPTGAWVSRPPQRVSQRSDNHWLRIHPYVCHGVGFGQPGSPDRADNGRLQSAYPERETVGVNEEGLLGEQRSYYAPGLLSTTNGGSDGPVRPRRGSACSNGSAK